MVCYSRSEMAGHICFTHLNQLCLNCQILFSFLYLVSNRQRVKKTTDVLHARYCKLYRPSQDPVLWGWRWPTGLPTYSCSTRTWCTVSSCRLNSGPEGVAAPSQASQSIKPHDSGRHTVEQSEKHRAKHDYSAVIDTVAVEQVFHQHKRRKKEVWEQCKDNIASPERRSKKGQVSGDGDYEGFRLMKMEAGDCDPATKIHGVTLKL